MANFSPALPPTPFLPKMTSKWSQVCRATGSSEGTTVGELLASSFILRREGILAPWSQLFDSGHKFHMFSGFSVLTCLPSAH